MKSTYIHFIKKYFLTLNKLSPKNILLQITEVFEIKNWSV